MAKIVTVNHGKVFSDKDFHSFQCSSCHSIVYKENKDCWFCGMEFEEDEKPQELT